MKASLRSTLPIACALLLSLSEAHASNSYRHADSTLLGLSRPVDSLLAGWVHGQWTLTEHDLVRVCPTAISFSFFDSVRKARGDRSIDNLNSRWRHKKGAIRVDRRLFLICFEARNDTVTKLEMRYAGDQCNAQLHALRDQLIADFGRAFKTTNNGFILCCESIWEVRPLDVRLELCPETNNLFLDYESSRTDSMN